MMMAWLGAVVLVAISTILGAPTTHAASTTCDARLRNATEGAGGVVLESYTGASASCQAATSDLIAPSGGSAHRLRRFDDETLMYVTASFNDPTDSSSSSNLRRNITLVAQSFPRVDKLTLVKIPNANIANAEGRKLMSLPNVYIDVVFVYKNQMYRPTQPKRFTNDAGQGVYYRSVIVTLSNGDIQSVEWEETYCIFAYLNCIDSMYAYDIGCLDGINIFVMWAGTDLTGGVANYLQTVSQSIYKLRMLP